MNVDDTLSTLISFVVFLITFSMIVQAVQEALKNILKLKAGVWERFFISLYKNNLKLENEAKSTPRKKREFVGDFDLRLNRISEFISKTHNLLKDIKAILSEIKEIKENGANDSKALLKKIENLLQAISELSSLNMGSLLSIFNQMDGGTVDNFTRDINTFLEESQISENLTLKEKLDLLKKKKDLILGKCVTIYDKIIEFEKKISQYRVQLENNIDSWKTQVYEEYKSNMLKWTVIIGAVLVLSSNADSFTIYKHLNTNSKIKSAVTAKTDKIEPAVKPDDINELSDLLREEERDQVAIKNKITEIKNSMRHDYKRIGAKVEIDKLEVLNEKKEIKEQADLIIELYGKYQVSLIDHYYNQMDSLDLPLGKWPAFFHKRSKMNFSETLLELFHKISGLLLTIFLVAFGAPFWQKILNALFAVKTHMKKKQA